MNLRHCAYLAIIGAALLVESRPATACGGTFCDSGPQAMPVDQTGENVLFVMDGETVEAHVQIQYTGDPMRFAWVVPMPAVPEVEVGSQLLFQNLLAGTVPLFNNVPQRDVCAPQNSGAGGSIALGTGGTASGGGSGPGGGPQVVFKATVGAFEVTVLQGGTAEEVSSWLETNNYQSIPSAPAILADYVAQNFVFVAIKLTAGAGVDEIHPLVFRYTGTEPCVPLKLTAVAAQEDMGVRVFFLGDDRFYPTNYKHVEINPARLDWINRASNYNNVITRAVDSPIAEGHAFVTEYAGSTAVVNSVGVFSPSWDASRFATIAPEAIVDELTAQGLAACFSEFQCQFAHPLVLPLLQEYLPVPAGMTLEEFYSCLSCNVAEIDTAAWDPAAFAAAFDTRIVQPGAHAQDLLAKWPFLTRMFTTMSPSEMTEDPLFHARPDLGQFVTRSFSSTQRITCCGDSAVTLPDAREVAVGPIPMWPPFSSLMPYAEKIVEVPLSGPVVTLVDNTVQIDEQLMLWNEEQAWPPTDACMSSGDGGPTGSGQGGTGNPMIDPVSPAGNSDGCGCSLPTSSAGFGGYLTVAAAAVSMMFRRRRRTS